MVKLFDTSLIGNDPQGALDFITTLLQSSVGYSIIGKNLNDKILLWNEGAKRLFGYDPEEVIGKLSVSVLHTPKNREINKPKEIMDIALKTGKWEGRLTYVKKNGDIFTSETIETVCKDASGKETGFLIISRDATKELMLLNQFKEKEFYTRSLIESSLDPLMTIDPLGFIMDVNQQMEKITGFNRKELIGTPFEKYFTDKISAAKGIELVLKEKHVQNYELILKGKKGKETPVSYNAVTFYNQEGKLQGIFASARDITEQKIFEQKLKMAIANLERSNQELEQFAYIASHDLQEPLRMVASYTQLLEQRYKDKLDQDATDFIYYAVDGVKRMQILITQLLAYSRVTTLAKKPASCDCNQILEKVLIDLSLKIKDKKGIITFEKLPIINADETQIAQVFQNLISNGLKFCKEIPKIHIDVIDEKQQWVFSVEDNGIGIASDDFEKIFIIFRRLVTQEEFPGTGMGLAICKKIVERHGGKIWLESKVGKGSIFYFSIPK